MNFTMSFKAFLQCKDHQKNILLANVITFQSYFRFSFCNLKITCHIGCFHINVSEHTNHSCTDKPNPSCNFCCCWVSALLMWTFNRRVSLSSDWWFSSLPFLINLPHSQLSRMQSWLRVPLTLHSTSTHLPPIPYAFQRYSIFSQSLASQV